LLGRHVDAVEPRSFLTKDGDVDYDKIADWKVENAP